MSNEPQTRLAGALANFTVIVTNLIKIGGLIIVFHEILFRPELRPVVLGEAGFMMAGAQFTESAILAAVDRVLGRADLARVPDRGEKE